MLFLVVIACSTAGAVYGVFYPSSRRYLFWSIVLLSAIVAGMRTDVGRDFPAYQAFFSGHFPVASVEPGFAVYSYVCSLIDPSGRIGFLVSSLITCFGCAVFIRCFVKDYFLFAWHLYIGLSVFYINSLNLLRQHLAISVALAGLGWLRKSGYIKYFIHVAVASVVHYSVISYLLFLMVKRRMAALWLVLSPTLFIVVPMATLTFEKILIGNSGYSYYLDHSADNNPYLALLFLAINVSVAATFASRPHAFRSLINNIVMVSCICASLFIESWIFSSLGNFWLRIAALFYPALLVGVPVVFGWIGPVKVRQYLMLVAIVVVSGLFMVSWYPNGSFGFAGG